MFASKKGLDENKADEKFFEARGSTNSQVANILDINSSNQAPQVKHEAKVNLSEAAWGGEDDEIDIDDEIMRDANANIDADLGEESDIFVPPQPGADPLLNVLR